MGKKLKKIRIPEKFPHPHKYSCGISYESLARVSGTDEGRNHQLMFVSYYLHKFLKLYVSQTKNCFNFCFLLLIFLFRSLFLLLNQQFLFKVFVKVEEFSEGYLVVGASLIRKKAKLAEITTGCYSLSLVVTRCTTRCHSLLFVVTCCTTRCQFLSLVITRYHCPLYL